MPWCSRTVAKSTKPRIQSPGPAKPTPVRRKRLSSAQTSRGFPPMRGAATAASACTLGRVLARPGRRSGQNRRDSRRRTTCRRWAWQQWESPPPPSLQSNARTGWALPGSGRVTAQLPPTSAGYDGRNVTEPAASRTETVAAAGAAGWPVAVPSAGGVSATLAGRALGDRRGCAGQQTGSSGRRRGRSGRRHGNRKATSRRPETVTDGAVTSPPRRRLRSQRLKNDRLRPRRPTAARTGRWSRRTPTAARPCRQASSSRSQRN